MSGSSGTRRFTAGNTPPTLVDVVRQRAELEQDATACVYLTDGEDAGGQLTFAGIDAQARAIAARLQGLGCDAGDAAILLYPPGLEFFGAFFGCLYAGVMAVPLPVPRMKASLTQFLGILTDVRPRVLMTNETSLLRLTRMDVAELQSLICLTTEDTQPELARAWRMPPINRDEVAYLQYTSGSTADRKGVSITHGNVIANLLGIAERFGHHDRSVSVNWLPHTHDLGLVGGILQPLYHGHLNVLMSPTAFVQQPIRWLNAISRYRATYSNSPNFGYDLCVSRTSSDQRARLDLSSWEVALNGAEPVRLRTIEEFVDLFAPCGFRREAVFPAYGLAEATLVVSGGPRKQAPISLKLDISEIEQNRVVESDAPAGTRAAVACGQVLQSTQVEIVDPASGRRCADAEIGEIWVHAPGVARGYWNKPAETEQTFRARLSDGKDRPFLRTGDLGFLKNGELYISGRLKDLIIIRGANHYPQDIEWTVEQSHPAFRAGCAAAFSIDADGSEQLVVIAELEREHMRGADGEELARLARKAVAEEHELHLRHLVLLKTGTVSRTTSGKIQRRKCRAEFLAGELDAVWSSTDVEAPEAQPADAAAVASPAVTAAWPPVATGQLPSTHAGDLIEWLRQYADERLNSRLMDERRSIAPHVILDFGNRGVLGLQVPREFGGVGFGYVEMLRVIEQLGAIDQTLAMMTIVHNSLGISPILHHGAPALKADLLPRLASGRELAAFAITEPGAGSNPQAIASTATPDGRDAWRLRGQKSWSGTAGWSSVINVIVQNVDDSGSASGTSAFAVPRGSRGLRVGPEALTLGMRGMVQNTIFLEDARVEKAHALGDIGGGMKVAQGAMMEGRLAIGAACVGGMKRCLQLLARYAERRSVATGRLIDNPVLLERAGTISAALTALESLVMHVGRRLDEGADVPGDILIVCKTAGSEWFWRAADDLVQFLGGRGYIETNIAAQLLRDARVTRILEGPTEALTMFLGSRVVNDSVALHRFLNDVLKAPAVSTRLAAVAADVDARVSSRNTDVGEGLDRRRYAYSLVGQVATDAILLAATPAGASAHDLTVAQRRFDDSVASAMALVDSRSGMSAAQLAATVHGYTATIGDVEQSLAGEDHELDAMLARGPALPTQPLSAAPAAAAAPVPTAARAAARPADPAPVRVGAQAIEQFIVRHIATALKMPAGSIDPARSFFDYGLDSVTTVMLAASLEDWLGVECNPEMAYDVPLIRSFAARLASRVAAGQPEGRPAGA